MKNESTQNEAKQHVKEVKWRKIGRRKVKTK